MKFAHLSAVAFVPALLACDPSAQARYNAEAAKEKDATPPLYQGPLTVERQSGETRDTFYTDHGRKRSDLHLKSGVYHWLYDPVNETAYSWYEHGGFPQVQVQRGVRRNANADAYWKGRKYAHRLDACTAAGETGFIWEIVRPPNFKGPNGARDRACITEDGVILSEGVAPPAGGGTRMTWEATAVIRGRVQPDAFLPPASPPPP